MSKNRFTINHHHHHYRSVSSHENGPQMSNNDFNYKVECIKPILYIVVIVVGKIHCVCTSVRMSIPVRTLALAH